MLKSIFECCKYAKSLFNSYLLKLELLIPLARFDFSNTDAMYGLKLSERPKYFTFVFHNRNN